MIPGPDHWTTVPLVWTRLHSKQTISIALYNAQLISKALRYDPCAARDHTVLPATHTRTIPAFTPQPQGITALRPVPTYTAWCEKLAQGFLAACPAETRTHHLSIASPILYRQRHDATTHDVCSQKRFHFVRCYSHCCGGYSPTSSPASSLPLDQLLLSVLVIIVRSCQYANAVRPMVFLLICFAPR